MLRFMDTVRHEVVRGWQLIVGGTDADDNRQAVTPFAPYRR
jgi:hypothetical protein